jgi:hypothetical protein
MKPELYSRVVLTHDVTGEHLRRGDLAWVVDYVEHPTGGEDGAILEIFNVLGESLRVVAVPISAISTARPNQVPVVRELALVA